MIASTEEYAVGATIAGTVYRVRAKIGSGGMGSVYQVEHCELGRVFVLKALHGHLSSRSDLVARMRNEWRALGKLNHPNIVQVTDAGQTASGLPFFVMESLQGKTLAQLLMEQRRLPVRQACAIMLDVLAGLGAAHATGAIHRDVKPPNIFVVEGGETKLLDFGIAKLRDQAAKVVTAGGVSVGTPRYMAPEQAAGAKLDGRADIYAVALVLYELLVGRGPFAHINDPNELVMAHIGMDPERADLVDSTIPAPMADLIQRWLDKSPDSRPRTAELAAHELRSFYDSLPLEQESATGEATLSGSYDAPTWGGSKGGDSPASVKGASTVSQQTSVVGTQADYSGGAGALEATKTHWGDEGCQGDRPALSGQSSKNLSLGFPRGALDSSLAGPLRVAEPSGVQREASLGGAIVERAAIAPKDSLFSRKSVRTRLGLVLILGGSFGAAWGVMSYVVGPDGEVSESSKEVSDAAASPKLYGADAESPELAKPSPTDDSDLGENSKSSSSLPNQALNAETQLAAATHGTQTAKKREVIAATVQPLGQSKEEDADAVAHPKIQAPRTASGASRSVKRSKPKQPPSKVRNTRPPNAAPPASDLPDSGLW